MIHSAGKTSSATRPLIKIRPVLMSGPPLRQCRNDTTLDSDNAKRCYVVASAVLCIVHIPDGHFQSILCFMWTIPSSFSFIPCVRAEGGKKGGPTLRKHEDKLSLVKTLPQRKQATAGCLGRVLC